MKPFYVQQDIWHRFCTSPSSRPSNGVSTRNHSLDLATHAPKLELFPVDANRAPTTLALLPTAPPVWTSNHRPTTDQMVLGCVPRWSHARMATSTQ
jgi:hypothetical protein